MPNLEMLDHVVHMGINIKKGMVVDSSQNGLDSTAPGLTESIAQNLISRGLAKETSTTPTHTLTLVNGAQEPLPVTAPAGSGQKPNLAADEARKAQLKERQQAATSEQKQVVQDQANELAKPVVHAAAPTATQKEGPTASDVDGV
jgi:hypothetical protein